MSPQPDIKKNTEHYAYLFSVLSPDNLNDLGVMLADDVLFTDPFNQITGRDKMLGIFHTMFETMDNPHFTILDTSNSNTRGYIKWKMGGRLKSRPQFEVNLVGMSEVEFNHQGKVIGHIDHWDSASQLLARLPLIGGIIRWLLRRFAH